MRSPRVGRRQALALVAAATSGSGCLGLVEDGSDDATADGWSWPSVGGSVGNSWRAPADEPPTAWPAVVDSWDVGGTPTAVARGDTAAFAGESLLVLDEALEERWREGPPSDDYRWGRCALGPANLYAWGQDGMLHAFDPATGELEWTFEEPVHENAVESMHPDYLEAAPDRARHLLATLHLTAPACFVVTASRRVGWPDPDARVVALDPETGDELWIEPTEGAKGAVVTDEHLVVATAQRLLGYDPETGDVAWTHEPGAIEGRLPTLADDAVVVRTSERNRLVAVDSSSGDERWSTRVPPGSNPLQIGDRLYLLGAGVLFAVDLADGATEPVEFATRADRLISAGDTLYACAGSTLTALTTDGATKGEGSTAWDAEPVVLDDRLLIPRSDGTVRTVATQPTVDRLFGRDGAPDDDRLVLVAPSGEPRFEPDEFLIETGTTVHFAWGAPTTSFEVLEQPSESDWSPSEEARETDDRLEHTFSEPGRYEFVATLDGETARGSIVVTEEGYRDRVRVGPDGDFVFEPERLEIPTGTTVTWEWESSNHNLNPISVPEAATWNGSPEIVDDPFEYEHTFDVPGTYEYVCDPHRAAGMVGEIVVGDADSTAEFDGTITVGPNRNYAFDPAFVEIEPGTTVRFEWDSTTHNVSPQFQPSDADWEGHPEIVGDPNGYEHTFEVPGVYTYQCEPHAIADMTGTILVREE